MVKFERSNKKSSKKINNNKGESKSKRFDRDKKNRTNFGSKNRRDFKMTKVICSSCGKDCEVPFKPTTNKPLFCDNCFSKEGSSLSKPSSRDFEIINKKLDKIIKALNIE